MDDRGDGAVLARCRAKLEVLEIGIAAGQIDAARATAEYMQCVQDAAFIDA